jgi:hypothetical protein
MPSDWTFEGWLYVRGDDSLVGPLSSDRISELIDAGKLLPTARVWYQSTNGKDTHWAVCTAETAALSQLTKCTTEEDLVTTSAQPGR